MDGTETTTAAAAPAPTAAPAAASTAASTATNDERDERRPGLWEPMRSGGHQCWYPVLLSSDLAPGQSTSVDLCDGRIVVYRGADGVVRAMTAYCKHLGADLGVGDVVGDDLRCPFHHWRYGTDGRCSHIPTGDRIPQAARLFTFPVSEKWGIIWVFWGAEPPFEVPTIPTFDEKTMVSKSGQIPMDEPLVVDSWVFGTNIFDFAHFRAVHGIENLSPDVERDGHRMRWSVDNFIHEAVGRVTMTVEKWGPNISVTHGVRNGEFLGHLAASSPMGREGTKFFIVAVTRLESDDEEGRATADRNLDQILALHTDLLNEDLPIMNTLRLGEAHMTAADRQMARYLHYVRSYPRTTMAELERSVLPARGDGRAAASAPAASSAAAASAANAGSE